jgi:adenylate cyclase
MMGEGKTEHLRSLLTWLGLFVLGFGTWWSGGLEGLERSRTDVFHRLAGVRCEPQHVAIVGIDEEALAARPEEPLVFWTPHLARSIEVLHEVGVKTIAIDLLLTVSPEAWLANANLTRGEDARTFDRAFRKALGQGGTLLAAFETGTNEDEVLLPNRDYWLSLPAMWPWRTLSTTMAASFGGSRSPPRERTPLG